MKDATGAFSESLSSEITNGRDTNYKATVTPVANSDFNFCVMYVSQITGVAGLERTHKTRLHDVLIST